MNKTVFAFELITLFSVSWIFTCLFLSILALYFAVYKVKNKIHTAHRKRRDRKTTVHSVEKCFICKALLTFLLLYKRSVFSSEVGWTRWLLPYHSYHPEGHRASIFCTCSDQLPSLPALVLSNLQGPLHLPFSFMTHEDINFCKYACTLGDSSGWIYGQWYIQHEQTHLCYFRNIFLINLLLLRHYKVIHADFQLMHTVLLLNVGYQK